MSYAQMQVSIELKSALESLKNHRNNTLPKVLNELLHTKDKYESLQQEFFDYKQQVKSDNEAKLSEFEANRIKTGKDTKQAVSELATSLSLSDAQTIEFLLDHYHMSPNIDKATFLMWMSKKWGDRS